MLQTGIAALQLGLGTELGMAVQELPWPLKCGVNFFFYFLNYVSCIQSSLELDNSNGQSIYQTSLLLLVTGLGRARSWWHHGDTSRLFLKSQPGLFRLSCSVIFYEILLNPGIESTKHFLGLELQNMFRAY